MVLEFFILCAFGINNAALAAEAFEPGPSFIYDQIYTNLGTPAPCVRLLDKDDVFGCTSPQKGSVGSLYLIRTEEELKGLLTSSVSVFHWVDKKAVLLGGNLFNRTNVQQLSARSDVTGILVLTINDGNQTRRVDLGWSTCTEGATGYSPAEPYPNRQWGLYPSSARQWNPCGNSWEFDEETVPMFALDYADSQFFLEKALYNQQKKYNWPKWTAELNSFMWASENSETCLRRGHCDPMGGQSVWSGMEDTISKDKGIILAMTQADSSAFFHELATGGDAHTSSIAALLTAVHALADWRTRATIYNDVTNKMEAPTFQKELIFGFWTGEAWGYLGSRKFIWDIEHFECKEEGPTDYCKNPYKFTLAFKNLSLDRIEAIIELDQVGLVDIHSPRLYVHREGPEERTKKLWDLLNNISFASGVDVDAADSPPNWELPPSSLHSFLRAKRTIPGVVLSDYKSEYKNRYYHSRWDDATNVGVLNNYAGVCKVANYTARLLWSLNMGGAAPPPDLAANCDVAYNYMECLVYNNTCLYKQKLLGIKGGPATPNHYSGIFRRRLGEITLTSKFLYEALSVITSKQAYLAKNTSFVSACNKSSQCLPNQNMQCQLGLCRNATTYYHDAVSLGLTWQPDSLGLGTGVWVITNSTEPLYTEARWDTTGIRVFMSDNYLVELVVLLAGVIEFFVFLIVFWYIRKYMVLKK